MKYVNLLLIQIIMKKNKIIKIQRFIEKKKKFKNKLKEKCNNEEDFYTYDLLTEIDDQIFFFHIKTQKVLIGDLI